MESRLKALKVVELKEILTKAGVAIPAKANKPDLIAKIIETPAALEVFELTRGGGDKEKFVGTPAGGATPQPPQSATVSRLASETPATPNDLLAPPEPFDWSSGGGVTEATGKAASAGGQSESLPSTSAEVAAGPISSDPSSKLEAKAVVNKSTAESAPEEEDEEAKRRRQRAERFGIPIVEPKKPRPAKAQQTQAKPQKAAASQMDKSTTLKSTANGTNGKTSSGARVIVKEDVEKLQKRAERFSIKAEDTSAASSTASKKRSAPEVENVDTEEQERRRKRAERFGLPVKA